MSRILLVEDNPDLMEAVQSSLEDDGHEVFLATRASQAVALAVGQHPDAVLLDLGLPDRDGYQVLEDLRARQILVPVLIVSARNLEADKLRGFRLGADDYVTKPFSVMELLARLGALLRRSAWAVAGREALAAAPAPLDDDALRDRFGLTGREIAVTRLLVEGLSNAEIAQRLEVSYYTARNHTEKVLLKLGVPSRAAVGAIVYGKR
jgi:DNA-binding response OmpR family regulator